MSQLSCVDFQASFSPHPTLRCSFSRAGHILGSACLQLEAEGRTLGFTGDVGRPNDPVMRPPAALPPCNYLVIESTYGDRRHPSEDVDERLATITNATIERGGTLLIPAFAVGRTQHLLHLLARLREQKRIPQVPIYLDSPMAIDATQLLLRYPGDHSLTPAECERLGSVAHCTGTPDESRLLDQDGAPRIILSASGMATGGRVLYHLRRYLPEPQHTVLLVGYQASGTRGRSLQEGADELKIHGQYVTVRAQVAHIDGLSAHADYAELIDWLKQSGLAPRRVFVTHGEPGPADAFRRRLRDTFSWDVRVPELGSVAEL
ncbi:MAG: MBL fold metallo-hydrolase [Myxococcales bacterium]